MVEAVAPIESQVIPLMPEQPPVAEPLREQANALSSVPDPTVRQTFEAPVKRRKKKHGLLGHVSQNEKIFFIDNLATMLQAGLPLVMALSTLAMEAKSKTMRKALMATKFTVDSGGKLSEALKEHPEIFPPLFISVIEVGEAGGTLSDVLTRLAITVKKSKSLKSKIVNAMLYPVIVVIAIIVVVIVLMIYVFPQLIAIFKEVNVDLPIQTKIVIAMVDISQQYGLYILMGGFGFLAALMFGSRVRRIKHFYHAVAMRMPFVGGVWREVALTRAIGNLRMLMVSGVPIVEAFTITARTAGNLIFEDAFNEIGHEIELGQSVHESFAKRPRLFPSLSVSMARVGEETGKLDEIMGKLETFYEGRVENVFANLSTIIEPVLLLSIGVVVGFIAVAVIMPIYSLAQAF